MNKIVKKKQFSEKVYLFEIEAPLIAKSRKAGNFVIVRVGNKGERMPLTIADSDVNKGTITLVVQKVGLSSVKLCSLNEGDYVTDVVGPLGNPTHIEKFGTVICAGGGVGVAPMLPIIRALKAAGNRVLSVIAGRSKDLVILEGDIPSPVNPPSGCSSTPAALTARRSASMSRRSGVKWVRTTLSHATASKKFSAARRKPRPCSFAKNWKAA